MVHRLGAAGSCRPRAQIAKTPASAAGLDVQEMPYPLDHAAHRRRVLEDARAMELVEAEALERRFLIVLTPDRAADLRHLDGLLRRRFGLGRRGLGLGRGFGRRRLRHLLARRLGGAIAGGLRRLLLRRLLALVGHGPLLPRLGDGVAPPQHFAHLAAAPRRNRARADRAAKRIEGRLDHVVRIGRADRLRHDVLHAQRLEDGAHRAAGDDAGAGRGGAQDDLAGAIAADDVVMERAPFAQRHAHHAAARLVGRIADRLGHFARLARAIADTALAVADDDDRGKAEAPAAFHHLGDTVDADQLFDELAVVAIAIARLAVAIAAPAPLAARTAPASTAGGPSAAGGTSATAGRTCAAAWCACHEAPFLEIEAALAGGVGQGLDP